MNPTRATLLCTSLLLLSGAAMADEQSASRNLFTNLQRSNIDVNKFLVSLGTSIDAVSVMPTLVRGMYAIQERNGGPPMFFTNEAGTLFGGSDQISEVRGDGQPLRKLSAEEVAGLRAEVMENIYYDKLIKSTFGDGGGRRLLLRSAVNCPACKSVEEGLLKAGGMKDKKNGAYLNSTFYVVPDSLDQLEPNGWNSWKVVSSLWCQSGNDKVWQNFWARKEVPNSDIVHCPFGPREAARSSEALSLILIAVGATKGNYVPQLIREDGEQLNLRKMSDTEFGPAARPIVRRVEAKWLLNPTETMNFASKPIGKPELPGNQASGKQAPGKVSLFQLFKQQKEK